MTKLQKLAEKVLVTFVEAGFAYFVVLPHPQLNKTVIAGVIGAGLSAVYNLLRESTPPTPPATLPVYPPAPTPPVV